MHLSDIGINTRGSRKFLIVQRSKNFPTSVSELRRFLVFVFLVHFRSICGGGGLLAVSGFRPTHLAGSDKTTVGHNPTIVRELIFWYTFLWYHK